MTTWRTSRWYEQGENLFVEGTLQQRRFTPKDGSTRTVWEVVVRSYHLIESPRIDGPIANRAASAPDQVPVAGADDEGGPRTDATWPV